MCGRGQERGEGVEAGTRSKEGYAVGRVGGRQRGRVTEG